MNITQVPAPPFKMQLQTKHKNLVVHVTQMHANGLASGTITDVSNMPQYAVGDSADDWNVRSFTRIL